MVAETHEQLLARILKDVEPCNHKAFLDYFVSGSPWRSNQERERLINQAYEIMNGGKL